MTFLTARNIFSRIGKVQRISDHKHNTIMKHCSGLGGCRVSPQIPRAFCPIAAELFNASDLSHYLCFYDVIQYCRRALKKTVPEQECPKQNHPQKSTKNSLWHKHKYSIFFIHSLSLPHSEIMSSKRPMAWILSDLLLFFKGKNKILQ